MKWDKPPIDGAAVKELSSRFGTDLLTAAILVRRGITKGSELPYYLETDLRYLHSPFLFEDMPDAVERIRQAADEGENVLVFGDRDVDGITSTAVMVSTLREMGIEAEWRVPQGDDPYGLTMTAVEEFAARDGSLIITVDSGITNVEEIAAAAAAGIDTIVVDHHNPQDQLPPAVAIINPKVEESYPFDGLCACAVTAKVRQALALGRTELFGELVTLINARPTNDTVMVDAILLENGLEVDRVTEALVPGVASLQTSRLQEFLVGRKLVCYDLPLQQKLLAKGFGPHVDIFMLDLAEQVGELFPPLAGKSLLQIGDGSRMSRYYGSATEEIDVLAAMYQTVVDQRFPEIREAIESVMDLVAIASLADMMPAVDENRMLIRRGLERLNTTPWPGIASLARTLDLSNRRLGSREISWNLSPAINATGRMGTPSVAVELLLSEDEAERLRLSQEIAELNRQRRRVGDEAWRSVLPRAYEAAETLGGKIIAVHDTGVHRGVTGIIAGRLSRRFNRPATVLTSVEDSVVGSVRSARGFQATEFLQRFDDIFDKWGGHNEAAGFHLPAARMDEFWTRLTELAPQVSLEDEVEESIAIDAELPPKYLAPALEEIVRRFEPYGQAHPQLRFLARNMVLEDVQIIGREQDHLRLLLSGGGYKWPAVFWGAAERVRRDFDTRDRVDVVFEFSKNYFNGNENIQLVVLDIRRADEQVA
ncbi:MAG: single-stranded-DNA-specific exonuclease RecJ [Alkalispirochaeta sp.]